MKNLTEQKVVELAETIVDNMPQVLRSLLENLGITEFIIPATLLRESKENTKLVVISINEDAIMLSLFDPRKDSFKGRADLLLDKLNQERAILHLDHESSIPFDVLVLGEVEMRLEEKVRLGECSNAEVSGGLNVIKEMIEERGFTRRDSQASHH